MSTNSNLFSQGGGGEAFELSVQTSYFIYFMLGGYIPGMADTHITEFRQQAGSLGYYTDDLMLRCESYEQSRLALFQIKHAIAISEKNEPFRNSILGAWKDFCNHELFDPSRDCLYLVTANLAVTAKVDVITMLGWARAKASGDDFRNEVYRIGKKQWAYEVFRNIVRSENPEVTDESLFRFLRCYYILDYDLDREESITRYHLYALLEQSKVDETIDVKSIYDQTYSMLLDSNSKGGYYDLPGRPTALMNRLKNGYVSPIQRKLIRLSEKSQEMLEVISDEIGGYHLDRTELVDLTINRLQSNRILIAIGEPGAGKSAICRKVLSIVKDEWGGYVLAVSGSELEYGQLPQWFNKMGIETTLSNAFAHFGLQPGSVIYVDALEKLIDGDNGVPFRQLIKAVQQHPGLTLLISCRRSLVNILAQKFSIVDQFEEVVIPGLASIERDQVACAIPSLAPLLSNPVLAQLGAIPKYLDLAYLALKTNKMVVDQVSEATFKSYLWSAVVENIYNARDGMPARRAAAFIEISLARCRQMQSYVTPAAPDYQALSALQRDSVITSRSMQQGFAPTHDILEDWALVKFVERQFILASKDQGFFDSLGEGPSIRRAYRLWVAEVLEAREYKKIAFILRNLAQAKQSSYWANEALIAILNSSACQWFFEEHIAAFRVHDWALLYSAIHVMRTACKEKRVLLLQNVAIPIGPGWATIISILHNNFEHLPIEKEYALFSVLKDFSISVFAAEQLPHGAVDAAKLSFDFLGKLDQLSVRNIPAGLTFKSIVDLVLAFTGAAKDQVAQLLTTALKSVENDASSIEKISHHHAESILECVLEGTASRQVAKYLPALQINIFNWRWYDLDKKDDIEASKRRKVYSSDEETFGLKRKSSYRDVPDHPYNNSLYWTGLYHPILGISAMVNFINYTTKHFNGIYREDEIELVEVNLSATKVATQKGSQDLWNGYRNEYSRIPKVVTSTLQSLEELLFELACTDDERETFHRVIKSIMESSTSVATSAIVASVVQAYPELMEKWVINALLNESFLIWDKSRYDSEKHRNYNDDPTNVASIFQQQSGSRPHRLAFDNGLTGFFIQIVSKNSELSTSILNRIKATRLQTTSLVKNHPTQLLLIENSLNETDSNVDVNGKPEELRPRPEGYDLLDVAFRRAKVTYQEWQSALDKAIADSSNLFFKFLIRTFTLTGLQRFISEMGDDHRKFCLDTILREIAAKYSGSVAVSEMVDLEPFLKPLLSAVAYYDEQNDHYAKGKIFRHLLKSFVDTDTHLASYNKKFWPDLVDGLWRISRQDGLSVWKMMVRWSFLIGGLNKDAVVFAKLSNKEKLLIVESFIEQSISDTGVLELEKGATFDYYWFELSLLCIPHNYPSQEMISLLRSQIDLMIQLIEDDGKRRNFLNLNERNVIERIGIIIIENPLNGGKELLEYLCDKIRLFSEKSNQEFVWHFIGLLGDFFGAMINYVDVCIGASDQRKIEITGKFHQLWRNLLAIASKHQLLLFYRLIFFDFRYKHFKRLHWEPLDGLIDIFEPLIINGPDQLYTPIIRIFAGIGSTTLLPGRLHHLTKGLKSITKPISLLKETEAERLVQIVYSEHLDRVRNDPHELEAFLYLLERLIEEGSSEAYFIMQYVFDRHKNITG
jgi:hypothetical protein